MESPYALHEILEVHELAAFKTVCMTKSKTMQVLISDPGLKEILNEDARLMTRQLDELSTLLSKAGVQEMNT